MFHGPLGSATTGKHDSTQTWTSTEFNLQLVDVNHTAMLGFARLCSKKKHIMLLAVLNFLRNYVKIMLLSENYALCHRNYAT